VGTDYKADRGRDWERFQWLFSQYGAPMYVADPQTLAILDANDKALELYGYSPDQMLSLSLTDLSPMSPASVRADMARVGHTENTPVATQHRLANGTLIEVEVWSIPIELETGSTVCLSIVHDITERKQAEQRLVESELRLAEATAITHVGFWQLHTTTNTLEWSPEVYRIFRIESDEPPSLEVVVSQIHPEDRQRCIDALTQTRAQRQPLTLEIRILRPSGEVRHCQVYGYALTSETGQTTAVRGAIQDITTRKLSEEKQRQLERQIQHSQKLESMGILASGIAHDFNNMLTGILGNVDLALARLSAISPARDCLHNIDLAARNAADLCRQMLSYSGKGTLAIRPVDLSEIVSEMTRMVEVAVHKQIVIRYHLPTNLPAIEGDATQLRQIAMNLVLNASEAIGRQRGAIAVCTGARECDTAFLQTGAVEHDLPEGLYVYLEVSDTGCGMDDELLANLFEPFHSTKSQGRGLGMAAVLGIVRAHGGTIKVTSTPGRGTTVCVLFPATEKPLPTRNSETRPQAQTHFTGTVLLVDDEETVRSVGKRMLDRAGLHVFTAEDGAEAIEVLRAHGAEIDCVILDLNMPRMCGEEAFQVLRTITPAVPVLISSGYPEGDALNRFRDRDIAGFLQKPYNSDTLYDTLRGILRQ